MRTSAGQFAGLSRLFRSSRRRIWCRPSMRLLQDFHMPSSFTSAGCRHVGGRGSRVAQHAKSPPTSLRSLGLTRKWRCMTTSRTIHSHHAHIRKLDGYRVHATAIGSGITAGLKIIERSCPESFKRRRVSASFASCGIVPSLRLAREHHGIFSLLHRPCTSVLCSSPLSLWPPLPAHVTFLTTHGPCTACSSSSS